MGRRDRGAGLVEAALVMPILLMILFGIIDFSVAMNDWNSVRQGSREGARQGSVYTTGGDSSCSLTGSSAPNTATHELVCLVKNRTQLDSADTRVKISFADADTSGSVSDADYIQGDGSLIVCVQYPVESISGMFDSFLTNTTVTSMVEMRLEDINDGSSGEDPIRLYAETALTDWGFCT